MAEFRTVRMGFWGDPFIESLPAEGKLLYIYLITGAKTNNLGIIEVSRRRIAFETGISEEKAEEVLRLLEAKGKVVVDGDAIWLRNFIKHQCSTSPKIIQLLTKEYSRVSSEKIRNALSIQYYDIFQNQDTISETEDTVSIPCPYPINTVSEKTDTVPIPSARKEQEQEQEQLPPPTPPPGGSAQPLARLRADDDSLWDEIQARTRAEQQAWSVAESEAAGELRPEKEKIPDQQAEPEAHVAAMEQSPPRGRRKPRSQKDSCPHQAIIDAYHEILPTCARVRVWGKPEKAALAARWEEAKERQSLEWWRHVFGEIGKTPFLMGKCPPAEDKVPFRLSLGWFVLPRNFAKVLNGQYAKEGDGACNGRSCDSCRWGEEGACGQDKRELCNFWEAVA